MIYRALSHTRATVPGDLNLLETRDCGVVLTGGRGRISLGVELLLKQKIRHLVISGVHRQTRLVDLLQGQGDWPQALDISAITLEKQSRTTFGNAQQSWPVLEALRCQSFWLITSRLHMPRAWRTFEGQRSAEIPMYSLSIDPPVQEADPEALYLETAKYLFYSLWAFSPLIWAW